MTNELKVLDKTERKAWNVMAKGSEADARSVFGEEGANYVAWCAAADACYAYREAHELLGKEAGPLERGGMPNRSEFRPGA